MTFDIPCGSPPHHTNVMFWGFLLTVFIVNFLVVYFVVPVWNWFCRPFTHGVRRFSECGLNYEPFMCLDDGLPCFRPHPAGWEGSVAANEKAIAEATKHLVKLARSQAATRHRLMARLDTMEKDLTPAGEYMIKKQKADKLQESVRRRVDSEAAVMVNNRIAREVKGLQKAMSSGNASGQSGASMYIRAYVEPHKQMQAEELLHDITKACYETTPGLLGSIVNLSDVKVGGLLTYDIYVECETAEQLQTWINSDTRRNYLKLGASIFQLPKNVNTVDQMNVHDSVSSLFVQPANMYAAQREQTDTANEGAPFVWHPPTWKMYLAMNVAFTIVGYPMGDLWLLAPDGPLSKLVFADGTPWPLWIKVIINVTILVIVVVYVAVPIVIYYGAHWLFAPWRKSSSPIIAIAEEGLPCCLADGPPPGATESAEAEPAGVGVELV